MRKLLKKLQPFAPLLILILFVVGSLAFFRAGEAATPTKPAMDEQSLSRRLLSAGGSLDLPSDVLGDEGEEDPDVPPEQTQSPDVTEPPESQPTTTAPSESSSTTTTTSSSDKTTTTTRQELIRTPAPKSSRKTDTSQASDRPRPTAPVKPADPSQTPRPHAPTRTGGAGDPVNPGESEVPIDDPSAEELFRTTIKDGETIRSRHYEFEIIHLNDAYRVKKVKVSVNGYEQTQFNGKVLLNEGRNVIRVSVTYTDPKGKVVAVYQDYTVTVDLGQIIIKTDLTDRTVDTETITFTAEASLDGDAVPLSVTCRGETLTASGHQYTATLVNGENRIVLEAKKGERVTRLEFTVRTTYAPELAIKTDLKNQEVNNEDFSFYAYMVNGTPRARFTVVFNGKTITQKDSSDYRVKLDIGANVIRLKATDRVNGEKVSLVERYTITYVPLSTEETAPRLEYINVWEGMRVQGKEYKLDVQPVDYLGNRIFYNGITVKLNGVTVPYSWASEYTSYALRFQTGANDLAIRITDTDGRYADFAYTIYCDAVEIGDYIGDVTIGIDANVLGLSSIVAPESVPIYYGDTGAVTLTKFLTEKDFTYNYSGSLEQGFYLSRIAKPGVALNAAIPPLLKQYIEEDGIAWTGQKDDNSLSEFDYTRGSGWMYTLNGSFPNHGFADISFKDGDVVQLRFTLAFGKDIGGYTGDGSNYPVTW